MNKDKNNLSDTYDRSGEVFKSVYNEISEVIVGQSEAVTQIMIAMLCDGHALIESNPGLGKTLIISTLSRMLDLKFNRIQCTPDLMPSDITGTYVVEEKGGSKEFRFEPGPVFTNILLADEINRASPKTQSALLESMQEKQVTVGNMTYSLERPFFVLATQNPIEMEGTFPLPEAQLDRFLIKINLDYPSFEEENEIVDRYTGNVVPEVRKIMSKEQLIKLQMLTRDVPISEELKKKVIKIVSQTRTDKEFIEFGASPRASIALILSSKARALINGRNYVSDEDVQSMAYPVLRHRIILNFESQRKGISHDQVIDSILQHTKHIK
ncbi:MAG: ATPase family associated with various cellular activities (AAA) [ANME-2 cluster archaeon HR1]|nr:MAG: MoxR-like ATPase [ANME-2 cluster archaeon]PPA79778.1 MAG: ATPase family associated with various cellular activities (AAA) [ANME-2 cluster archaeon HR1]